MYKLLVVDDEPIIRKGIIKLINYEELAVRSIFEASDGRSALEIVKREKPDIILADINMPVMDGLEFAAKAKEVNRDSKIAMITGYNYFDYAVAALKAGVDDYVVKPVSKDDIKQLLVKLIHDIKTQRSNSMLRESVEKITGIKQETGIESEYRQDIINIIGRRYSDSSFSLKALADEIALSPGYLSSHFKEVFGITFHDYLISERLERAKILVLSSGMKNYEIAEQVGFEDPNYFSTAFKKRFGMSPSKFKAAAGEQK
jgi:two-component system response regulator YesN